MNNDYVAVIGGANVDLIGTPFKELVKHDSAPGRLKLSSGGVARNIAENLARMGVKTELITAFGNDAYGKILCKELASAGVGLSASLVVEDATTSMYLCLNSKDGEMQYGLSAMEILSRLDREFFDERIEIINKAAYVVLDTNLGDILGYILNRVTVPVIMDTVSTQKTANCLRYIKDLFLIKPNREEAEVIAGIPIVNDADVVKVSEIILNRGIKNVVITLGKDGAFYNNGSEHGFVDSYTHTIISTTGAGDSFVAAMVMGLVNKEDLSTCVKLGSVASAITVGEDKTVSVTITKAVLYNAIKP